MKKWYSVVLTLLVAGFASAAKEPLGTVSCEIPEGATTEIGSTYGDIIARVKTDSSLGRLVVDLRSRGSDKSIKLERLASVASKKYEARNPKYENSNRFAWNTESCNFAWILPKNLSARVNKFDGYLQQTCFEKKNGKYQRLNLETLTLSCRFFGEYKIDDDDKSPTAMHLTELAEQAQIANGTADVVKFNKDNFNETRALRFIVSELPNEKGNVCKYATLPVDKEADTIKAIAKLGDDPDLKEAVAKIKADKNLFKIFGRVTTKGDSESCMRYFFHVYTKDGYMLELDYDTGD